MPNEKRTGHSVGPKRDEHGPACEECGYAYLGHLATCSKFSRVAAAKKQIASARDSSDAKAERCTERVWDNGDMTDCGKPLPCAAHPVIEVEAALTLDAIRRLLDTRYAEGEKITDRLAAVTKLAVVRTNDASPHNTDGTLPCIRCDRPMTSAHSGQFPDINQPSNGLALSSPGHYGTTVFDPLDGSRIEVNLCDPCLLWAIERKRTTTIKPRPPAQALDKASPSNHDACEHAIESMTDAIRGARAWLVSFGDQISSDHAYHELASALGDAPPTAVRTDYVPAVVRRATELLTAFENGLREDETIPLGSISHEIIRLQDALKQADQRIDSAKADT